MLYTRSGLYGHRSNCVDDPIGLERLIRRFTLGKARGDIASVSIGDAGDEILQRRIRAFGNLIEYAPMCVILLALLENTSAPANLLWTAAGLVVFGRLIYMPWACCMYKTRHPEV